MSWSLLHDAAQNKSLNRLERLLSDGEDVNATAKDGQTALHIACHYGYTEIMTSLLNAKSDVEARTDTGATPLHLAARSGSERAISLLLRYASDAKALVQAKDRRGRTSAEYAPLGSPVVKLLDGVVTAAEERETGIRAEGRGETRVAVEEELPPGWILCWSHEQQRYYYQNNLTQVTQWEKPVVAQRTESGIKMHAPTVPFIRNHALYSNSRHLDPP